MTCRDQYVPTVAEPDQRKGLNVGFRALCGGEPVQIAGGQC